MTQERTGKDPLPAASRRAFLRVLALGSGAALVAACQPAAPAAAPTAKPAAPAAQPTAKPATAASPAASPAAKTAASPAASPAAKAAASPAASPAAKASPAAQQGPVAQQTNFYAGKTINIATFTSPGGGTELMLRTVMKHLPRFVPGNPQMGTVEYMRGGGGIVHGNHMWENVRPDGLTLGQFSSNQQEWAVGNPDVKFDMTKFEWAADVLPRNYTGLWIHDRFGADTFEEILNSSKTLNLGVTDVGHGFYREVRTMQYIMGPKFKVNQVPGYDSDEIDLAIMRDELDGRVQALPSLFQKFTNEISAGQIHVVYTFEAQRYHEAPNAPTILELAEKHAQPPIDQNVRQLLDFMWNVGRHARYYGFSPGTPREAVDTMREAFRLMVADPEFSREFEQQTNFIPEYTSGAVMQNAFEQMRDTPESVKKLFLDLASTDPIPTRA